MNASHAGLSMRSSLMPSRWNRCRP
jgi:hypothetical protein